MQFVGASPQYRVELPARGMPELRAELVLQHRKFRHGVIGHRPCRTRHILTVVIDALDREVVVARPLATLWFAKNASGAKTHVSTSIASGSREPGRPDARACNDVLHGCRRQS